MVSLAVHARQGAPAQQAAAADGAGSWRRGDVLVSASLLIPFEEAGRFVRGGGGVDLTAPQLSGMALGRQTMDPKVRDVLLECDDAVGCEVPNIDWGSFPYAELADSVAAIQRDLVGLGIPFKGTATYRMHRSTMSSAYSPLSHACSMGCVRCTQKSPCVSRTSDASTRSTAFVLRSRNGTPWKKFASSSKAMAGGTFPPTPLKRSTTVETTRFAMARTRGGYDSLTTSDRTASEQPAAADSRLVSASDFP